MSGRSSSTRQSATRRRSPPESLVDVGVGRRQPQRVHGDLQRAVEVPAVGRLDRVLQLALLVEQLVHLAGRQVLAELQVHLVEAREQPLGLRHRLLDVARARLLGVELRLLRQVADADAVGRLGLAEEVLVDAGHDPQQRRLARRRSTRGRRSSRPGRTTDRSPSGPPCWAGGPAGGSASCRCTGAPWRRQSSRPLKNARRRPCVAIRRLRTGLLKNFVFQRPASPPATWGWHGCCIYRSIVTGGQAWSALSKRSIDFRGLVPWIRDSLNASFSGTDRHHEGKVLATFSSHLDFRGLAGETGSPSMLGTKHPRGLSPENPGGGETSMLGDEDPGLGPIDFAGEIIGPLPVGDP